MLQAAEAAVRQAEAEGLTLQPSDNAMGYRGVSSCSSSKRFAATVRRSGEKVHLGYFDTAQEAALAYARTPEAQAEAAKPASLSAEEVMAQVAAEGLTLEPSSSASGYKGVSYKVRDSCYQAHVTRAGNQVHLGCFATAEEAALAYARTPEAQAQVANPKPMPLTAEEAVAQAAAEGLKLEPSYRCASGYRGVKVDGSRYPARANPNCAARTNLAA